MSHFVYTSTETDYLAKRDRRLGAVIRKYGMLERKVTPDIFEALVDCIIGQQVSSKAEATVSARIRELVGAITPEAIRATDAASIQQCGMTLKKAGYIVSAADAFQEGRVNPEAFDEMTDEAIVKQLVAFPGIGRWTAEMLLLHALQRPDVFSYDDLVIRRSLISIHQLTALSRADFEVYRERYSPYCSVAMIYLWRYGAGG
jgi:DNA-3-methyladenine glycosylase II